MAQNIFERYEKKYLITKDIQEILLSKINDKIDADNYGSYTISNIYYDTNNYDLIRNSIEKPLYKEKLRMRSYKTVEEESLVFIELKKKYKGVVYKRRISLGYKDAKLFLQTGKLNCETKKNSIENEDLAFEKFNYKDMQIAREIEYFLKINNVSEKIFLSYDRRAYKGIEDDSFRITFDTNIKFRQNNLSLSESVFGKSVLSENQAIMEIKFLGVMPIWMSKVLSDLCIFTTSFSKYGTCYKEFILKSKLKGEVEKVA